METKNSLAISAWKKIFAPNETIESQQMLEECALPSTDNQMSCIDNNSFNNIKTEPIIGKKRNSKFPCAVNYDDHELESSNKRLSCKAQNIIGHTLIQSDKFQEQEQEQTLDKETYASDAQRWFDILRGAFRDIADTDLKRGLLYSQRRRDQIIFHLDEFSFAVGHGCEFLTYKDVNKTRILGASDECELVNVLKCVSTQNHREFPSLMCITERLDSCTDVMRIDDSPIITAYHEKFKWILNGRVIDGASLADKWCQSFINFLDQMFVPICPRQSVLLIVNGEDSLLNEAKQLRYLEKNNVKVLFMPSHLADKLRPVEDGFLNAFRSQYQSSLEKRIESGGTLCGNRHELIMRSTYNALNHATTSTDIAFVFEALGLYPLGSNCTFEKACLLGSSNHATNPTAISANDEAGKPIFEVEGVKISHLHFEKLLNPMEPLDDVLLNSYCRSAARNSRVHIVNPNNWNAYCLQLEQFKKNNEPLTDRKYEIFDHEEFLQSHFVESELVYIIIQAADEHWISIGIRWTERKIYLIDSGMRSDSNRRFPMIADFLRDLQNSWGVHSGESCEVHRWKFKRSFTRNVQQHPSQGGDWICYILKFLSSSINSIDFISTIPASFVGCFRADMKRELYRNAKRDREGCKHIDNKMALDARKVKDTELGSEKFIHRQRLELVPKLNDIRSGIPQGETHVAACKNSFATRESKVRESVTMLSEFANQYVEKKHTAVDALHQNLRRCDTNTEEQRKPVQENIKNEDCQNIKYETTISGAFNKKRISAKEKKKNNAIIINESIARLVLLEHDPCFDLNSKLTLASMRNFLVKHLPLWAFQGSNRNELCAYLTQWHIEFQSSK